MPVLEEIPVDAPASVPQAIDDPLDMRNPTPVIKAPGDVSPTIEPLGAIEPVIVEDLDLGGGGIEKARAVFMARIAREDGDLKVLATALKLRGYSVNLIANGLGVKPDRIRRVLKQARCDGQIDDVLRDLTTDALPLAVEKLIDALENGQQWAIQDTLKGLGAFRTHHGAEGGALPSNNLEVNFIMPTMPQVMNPRGIVGAPRGVIDAVQVEEATAEVSRDGVAGRDQPQDGRGIRRGDEGEAGGILSPAGVGQIAGEPTQ